MEDKKVLLRKDINNMSCHFKPGSIYYNSNKKFYLLVTEHTNDLILGYTSRYECPSSKDIDNGLNRELVGSMDFKDFKIAFGNKFNKSTASLVPEENEYIFVRNLEKKEYQVFRLIRGLLSTGKLTYLKDPDITSTRKLQNINIDYDGHKKRTDRLFKNTITLPVM